MKRSHSCRLEIRKVSKGPWLKVSRGYGVLNHRGLGCDAFWCSAHAGLRIASLHFAILNFRTSCSHLEFPNCMQLLRQRVGQRFRCALPSLQLFDPYRGLIQL